MSLRSTRKYNHDDVIRNMPFPRCRKLLFQNEAKCKTFLVKMIFYYLANKAHFHKKGFALSLVSRVRVFGTRKWSIPAYLQAPAVPKRVWGPPFSFQNLSSYKINNK